MILSPSIIERPLIRLVAGGVLLALALFVAYSNSLQAPFLLDDFESIEHNESLTSLADSLSPPANSGATVAGRPLLNFSFALSRLVLGPDPAAYRIGNLTLHFLAALLLWASVAQALRHTLLEPSIREKAGRIAWFLAALWSLHPLQTAAVTYLSQRAEVLAAVFWLLSFHSFQRSLSSSSPVWKWLSLLACLCGMATKETVASLPLFLLLYDRGTAAGSFREAWGRRRSLYMGMLLGWGLLALLVLQTGARGSTVGFSRVGSLEYLLTQGWGILGYLKSVLYPCGLVFDHGAILEKQSLLVVIGALGTGGLFVASVLLIWGRHLAGLLGAWFFLGLAPSSSLVPVATQTLAEHRMYLPLAAVLLILVLALQRLRPLVGASLGIMTLVGGLVLTHGRNHDYRSSISIWEDTVAKVPDNARAWNNLGIAYEDEGRVNEAMKSYQQAIVIAPDFALALGNLGRLQVQASLAASTEARSLPLSKEALLSEGMRHLAKSVELEPRNPVLASHLGSALMRQGRREEALPWLEKAYDQAKDKALHGFNLANNLMELGRHEEALRLFQEAVLLSPKNAEILGNLGVLLRRMERIDESVEILHSAVSLDHGNARLRSQLGVSLMAAGRRSEAKAELLASLSLDASAAQSNYFLGVLYAEEGSIPQAVKHFEALLRVSEPSAEILCNLGVLYAQLGDIPGAIHCFEQALRLDPKHPASRENLLRLKEHSP